MDASLKLCTELGRSISLRFSTMNMHDSLFNFIMRAHYEISFIHTTLNIEQIIVNLFRKVGLPNAANHCVTQFYCALMSFILLYM